MSYTPDWMRRRANPWALPFSLGSGPIAVAPPRPSDPASMGVDATGPQVTLDMLPPSVALQPPPTPDPTTLVAPPPPWMQPPLWMRRAQMGVVYPTPTSGMPR